MRAKILALPIALLAGVSFAASDTGQIETTTTENGVKTEWTVISVGEGKKIRVDGGGWNASASASGAAAAGSGGKVSYDKGRVKDTMIYDPETREIMSVEGKVCRVMNASAGVPGMGHMNSPEMQAHQKQMAEAMAGANKQIAEAMAQMKKEGASQAEMDAMNQVLGGFNMAGQVPNKDALEVELVDKNVSVGKYKADVYLARTASGIEKYRFYMADVDDIPGSQPVRDGMVGMMETFAEMMDNMGVGGLMDEGISTVIASSEFKGQYPVAIDDLQRNTHTEVTNARADAGNVDFSPDCEKRDMMSY